MPRIITITSTNSGAGKKSVALNLALALRRGGRKVLLVDTGLVTGEVGDLVSGTSPKTVAEFFAGQGSLAQSMTNIQGGLVIMQAERRGGAALLDTDMRSYAIAAPQLDLLEKFDDMVILCQADKDSDNIAFVIASDLAVLLLGDNQAEKDTASLLGKIAGRGYRGKIMLLPNRFENSTDAGSAVDSVVNQAGESAPESIIIELPPVPADKTFDEAKEGFTPLVLGWPDSPAGIAICKVADEIGAPSSQQVNAPLSAFFRNVFRTIKEQNAPEPNNLPGDREVAKKPAIAQTATGNSADQKVVYLNNPAQSAPSPEFAKILERNCSAQERLAEVLENFAVNAGSTGRKPGFSGGATEPFPIHSQLQPGEVKTSYQTLEYFQKEN